MKIKVFKSFSLSKCLKAVPWKAVLATIVTLIVFGILFSRIDFRQTMALLVTIKPGYLVFAVVLSLFSNIMLPTEEWRLILKALGKDVSFRKLLFIKLGVAPIKNAVPLKSGELVRVLCLKKISGISFSAGILSVFISLIFGLFVLFIIAMGGCIYFTKNPYSIGYISFAGSVFTLFVMVFSGKITGNERILNFLGKLNGRISDGAKKLGEAFLGLRLSGLILPFIFGVIIKICELVVFYLIFRGLGVSLPLSSVFIFVPVTMLVSVLPIAFLGLGIREGVVVLLFAGCASSEIVLSGGLLFSFIDYVLPAVAGSIFTRRLLGILMKDFSKEAKEAL